MTTVREMMTANPESVDADAPVQEAAAIMKWDRRRVVTYIDRGSFPEPVASLASGRIWRRSDIEAFAREWRRRHPAPKTRKPTAKRRTAAKRQTPAKRKASAKKRSPAKRRRR